VTNLAVNRDSGYLAQRRALWAILDTIDDDGGTRRNSSTRSLAEMFAGGIFIAVLASDTYAASLKLCDGSPSGNIFENRATYASVVGHDVL